MPAVSKDAMQWLPSGPIYAFPQAPNAPNPFRCTPTPSSSTPSRDNKMVLDNSLAGLAKGRSTNPPWAQRSSHLTGRIVRTRPRPVYSGNQL